MIRNWAPTRLLPWGITAVCFLALGASGVEVRRLKTKLGDVSRHTFHDHADVREFIIHTALRNANEPIVVIGDSITEMAPLPQQVCGHPVINAGIGGMNTPEAKWRMLRILRDTHPFLLAVALGANDRGSTVIGNDFEALLRLLQPHSVRPILAISVADDAKTDEEIGLAAARVQTRYIQPALPLDSKMEDGVHYTNAAYKAWIPALTAAILKECE